MLKIITKRQLYLLFLLGWFSTLVNAAVLPEERADLMLHSYEGGELEVNGPALLVRKNIGNSWSVFYNAYEDNITSASIDVQISGSPYEEHRVEQTVGVDYLNGKTLMNGSFTVSSENDYNASTFAFGISQDFFGDLTNISMGLGFGVDEVSKRQSPDPSDISPVLSRIERYNYRVALTQILTKNTTVGLALETITDEAAEQGSSGVTLNNPYRQYSFYNGTSRSFADEIYPNTRTSNAIALRGNYFLETFKSAIHLDYRWFQDSWGIDANTYSLTYVQPIGHFIVDFRARYYEQTQADFYSDIFDFQDQFTYMARDKELSTFSSTSAGFSIGYEFARNGWKFIDKGSLNFSYDLINFEYENFRDATQNSLDAGTEPLYSFDAEVMQIFVSFWF